MSDEGFLGLMVGFVIAVCLIALAVLYVKEYRCNTVWPAEMEPQYDWIAGCTVVTDGLRVPGANVRIDHQE